MAELFAKKPPEEPSVDEQAALHAEAMQGPMFDQALAERQWEKVYDAYKHIITPTILDQSNPSAVFKEHGLANLDPLQVRYLQLRIKSSQMFRLAGLSEIGFDLLQDVENEELFSRSLIGENNTLKAFFRTLIQKEIRTPRRSYQPQGQEVL